MILTTLPARGPAVVQTVRHIEVHFHSKRLGDTDRDWNVLWYPMSMMSLSSNGRARTELGGNEKVQNEQPDERTRMYRGGTRVANSTQCLETRADSQLDEE